MQSATLSVVLLALLVRSSSAYDVPKLTAANYAEATSGKTVFIKAFAPWCGHCKAMADDWKSLAEEYKDHKVALVAEIDCTEEDDLCQTLGVEGFPTLFYGDADSLEQYDGGRDLDSLKTFAEENITKPVCSLKNLDICSDEEKKAVEELRSKSKEDLEAIVTKADEDMAALNDAFMEKVEALQNQYQEMSATLADDLLKVKTDTNYKWLTKIFTEKGGELKPSGMGDEL